MAVSAVYKFVTRCVCEAENLFGRPLRADDGVEQYLDQLRDPRGASLARDELLVTRVLQGETVAGQELLCRRLDGRELPVLVSAASVRNEPAGIVGAVVVYKDISALKELERLRNEWTSIIAHDLRQPVQVIALQANMLAKDVTDLAQKAKMGRILSAVDQLTRMIADLLDVSRIDVRELPLRLETVDIMALARDVVERMGEEPAGLPIRVEARGEVPPIEADALRLGEVFCNLLSNAVKYGYPGTAIDVEIEAREGEVVVSVTNQGDGIPPEEIPKLFERFRRTERAVRGIARGVGLGLYIAKGLVEAHGGRMWAESVPGRRTTFRFTLPAQRAAQGRGETG
jgi:signal transduction histidine kinase